MARLLKKVKRDNLTIYKKLHFALESLISYGCLSNSQFAIIRRQVEKYNPKKETLVAKCIFCGRTGTRRAMFHCEKCNDYRCAVCHGRILGG